jgi:hypothetical protein
MEKVTEVDMSPFPLTRYFLEGYLAKTDDQTNFPNDRSAEIFGAYETLFTNVLTVLGIKKELLKSRTEFNFDSGNAPNLEGGIAILRVVEALRLRGFSDIALVSPPKGEQGADITALKAGVRVCLQVKAVTKQSRGREGFYFQDQLYEKGAGARCKSGATVSCFSQGSRM